VNANAKFAVVLLVFLLIVIAFAGYQSIADATPDRTPDTAIGPMRWRGWIDPFFSLLPIAVASATVVSFSFAISAYDLGGSGSLLQRVRVPLIVILLLGSLSTLWYSYFESRVTMTMERLENQARFLEQLLEDAERFTDTGRLDLASDRIALYRSISGDDADTTSVNQLESRLNDAMRDREIEESGLAPEETGVERVSDADGTGLNASEMIDRAKDAYASGDYFTAHYNASRALELNPGPHEAEARRIQSEAMNAIESQSRELEEADDVKRFDRKITAYESLQLGKQGSPERIIDAYYLFEALYRDYPDDEDVIRYRAETAEQLENVAFFVEEANEFAFHEADYELFFRNGYNDDSTEFVWIHRVVDLREGTWFYDIEVMRISEIGAEEPMIDHYGADYGKLIGDRILLRAIRRDDADADTTPRVSPTYYQGKPRPAIEEMIELTVPLASLMRLAGGPQRAVALPLPTLVRVLNDIREIGRSEALIWRELAHRIVRIVGFFVISIWSIAIAWRYRSQSLGRPPIIVLCAVSLVPIVVYLCVNVARTVVFDSIDGLLVSGLSGQVVVTIVAVVSALAVVAAFFDIGRQSVEP
jgi:hypothetical protein